MSNPIDSIAEAKALKEQLTKVFREFAERTNYMVRKVEIMSYFTTVNAEGKSRQQLTETELQKVIVMSSDGSVVEV